MIERWLEIPPKKSCLIVGPRRSGKTILLKDRYPELTYATLDDLDHLDWAKRHIKAAKTYFADNGIIHSLNARVSDGQLLENFVLAELEKRRKLGMIPADQFYYYKSAAKREIDLLFEVDNTVYAVEIKATKRPGPKDYQSLKQFEDRLKRPVKRILFYLGEEYSAVDGIRLIPIGALHRGK